MYAYIKGTIESRNDSQIVIDNNGVGYLINCPIMISATLGKIGEQAKVYVYQSVREDDISLYGFADASQKDIFLKLLTVSGIGPKVAHNICSTITPEQIAVAVMSGDIHLLTSVKGLGKKTAERIVLELKDKLKEQQKAMGSIAPVSNSAPVNSSVTSDAAGALLVLGYKESEASSAVAAAYEEGITLEELIKKSLKIASGSKIT
ncbi:MAG: Holliday junction branch migration protein RuvA [Saccharofermentans sp.]|nr:Holliday junction branch migration protein RuvA [Saccharofermentans sp.]